MPDVVYQKRKVLGSSFFLRPTLTVAREFLGKFLVRRYRGKEIAGMITEVEAYDGFNDKASHASRGLTERNRPMFGPAGYWYVYLVYGTHWMLNVITREKGYPAAVLIRAVQLVDVQHRPADGPGKTTKTFHIDKRFNNKSAKKLFGLWIEDRGVRIKKSQIQRLPRIGVDYAGVVWKNKKYRFLLL